MFFVGAIVERLAGFGMKLLACPFSDGAVELDVRRIQLWFAWFERVVEALNQPGDFIAIKIAVVIVEIVEVGFLFILRLIVAALHPPNISPVGGRRVIGAE